MKNGVSVVCLLVGVALFAVPSTASILVTGKYTDNTCTIRGDWKYIKQIDETITEVR